MFAPFTVGKVAGEGQLEREADPVVHWGNVDTGAMVNIVYSGVVDTHPGLARYKSDFTHVVKGVGDKTTKVIYKLVGVPISVGSKQVPGSFRRVTFYVLDCPSYHWILGLSLLQAIDAGVFCSSRTMQFKLGKAGKGATQSIPLVPRSQVKLSPAYLTTHPPAPHAQALTTIPETAWEPTLLEEAHTVYVEQALVDVAAYAALNAEATSACPPPPLHPDTQAVDPLGTTPPPPTPLPPCSSPPPAPAEQEQALHVLSVDSTLPAWVDATHTPPSTPRSARKRMQR